MAVGAPGALPSSFHTSHLSLCGKSGWQWDCSSLELERREGSQVPRTREPCREEHRPSWLHPFSADVRSRNRQTGEQDSLPTLSNLGSGEGGDIGVNLAD